VIDNSEATGSGAADVAPTCSAGDLPVADVPVETTSATDRPRGALLGGPMKLLLSLACAVIIIYGMRYAAGVLDPILLALFIVMGMSPMIRWMRSKRVPSWATLVIMLVLVVVAGLLFVSILAVSLRQLDNRLPIYQDRLGDLFTSINQWLSAQGIDAGGMLGDVLSADRLAGIAKSIISSLFGAFSDVLLMFLIVLFMTSEVFQFPEKLRAHFGTESRFGKAASAFGQDTRSYLFIKTWLSALTAVIMTIVFYALGVDFPLLWGMLFFLLSYIPNLGFVISVIPPVIVTLLEQSFWRAVILLAVILVVNTIFDNAISPRIMGRGVGLTSLAVFLSLVLWAWVLGPVGALISVPLTIMVKRLFLESFEETQFLAEALSSGDVVEKVKKRRSAKPEPG
jgi:AI-2 transport protein TqsA